MICPKIPDCILINESSNHDTRKLTTDSECSFPHEESERTLVKCWSEEKNVLEDVYHEEIGHVTIREEKYFQMRDILEDALEKQRPQAPLQRSLVAQTSERTTSSFQDLNDKDLKLKYAQIGGAHFVRIQEDEYFHMNEIITWVTNAKHDSQENFEGIITDTRIDCFSSPWKPSCMDTSFQQKNEEINHKNKQFIHQLKHLALEIAECKAENDLKDLELKKLRSALNMSSSQSVQECISRNTIKMLENRLQYCYNKVYENEDDFLIEYIISLSHLLAECKSEIDLKHLEIMNLKKQIFFEDENDDVYVDTTRRKERIGQWLKNASTNVQKLAKSAKNKDLMINL